MNLPSRTSAVKAVHSLGVTISAGPVGFFESRTAQPPSVSSAISTQSPEAPL